ncbi:MAG: YihY/virulence factor BrkB family protein [Lachnospiraceae bacterium]|nr:YihY/virulence factor BrkB family protein [Lachnospiraceae bacterium]
MLKSIFGFCDRFSKKVTRDAVSAYSGEAALYVIISLFPFLMFLLTLLKYLPFSQAELLKVLSGFFPNNIYSYIVTIVEELYSTSGTVLSVTIILALWSASRGILTIYRGLNKIYGIDETRNYFFLRLKSMLYTFAFSIILIMLLGLYVFGNQIKIKLTESFPQFMQNKYTILVVSFRAVIGIVILMILFIAMYNYMPNRRSKIQNQLPGAVIASLGWVGFSYLYSFYIDHMGSIMATYGSLTAAVLCILWLYCCMSIFFFGAEVNSVLGSPEVQAFLGKLFKPKKAAEKHVVAEIQPQKAQSSEITPDMANTEGHGIHSES